MTRTSNKFKELYPCEKSRSSSKVRVVDLNQAFERKAELLCISRYQSGKQWHQLLPYLAGVRFITDDNCIFSLCLHRGEATINAQTPLSLISCQLFLLPFHKFYSPHYRTFFPP